MQRNYCVKLFRTEKKKYYNNLDNTSITDNKKIWKTIKPVFSDKRIGQQKIVPVENDDIISNDEKLANTFNTFFPTHWKTFVLRDILLKA